MRAESATMIADVVEHLRPKGSYSIWIWRLLVGAALLIFWQSAAGTLIREAYLAKPTSVMWRLYELFATAAIWVHIRVTLTEVVIGYLMGSFLGLAVGFLLGSSRFLAVVFEPYVMAFYGIPRIALAPIFIIVLGIGIWSKVAVVFIQVFFMLFINAYAGVREINQEYLQLARIMGAKGGLILRKIRSEKMPIKVAVITAAGSSSPALKYAEGWDPDAVFAKPLDFGALRKWMDQSPPVQ